MSVSYGGDSITFADGSVQSGGWTGFKNRIINGAMVIDQRNAGAVVNMTSAGATYTLDRWVSFNSADSKLTVQQNANSVTPPTGFTNYLGVVSTSAYTATSAQAFSIGQFIEGYNASDLAWGTANAKTVTISFWVRSSLTGTFSGSFQNANNDRTFAFTYTINIANTWEQKIITVSGDTTGTWGTTTGRGVSLRFNMGSGSTLLTTEGSWQAANALGVTGSVSVIGTSGATWYITGFQLERGSTASSFEYRPYGTELALCQRYLPAFTAQSGTVGPLPGNGTALGTGSVLIFNHPVPARVPGTGVGVSAVTHFNFSNNDGNSPSTAVSFAAGSPDATQLSITVASSRGATTTPGWFYANNTAARLYITGCEI